MIPCIKLLLEYKHFFFADPPADRLSLIKHIPKKQLLYEIAGLNYRLKPYNQLKYDFSLNRQIVELKHFCPIDKYLQNNYIRIVSSYIKSEKDYPLIFNRAANLFAIEEILNNDNLLEIDDFDMKKVEVWDGIFKYLMSVNREVLKVNQSSPHEVSIENISSSALVLNELMIEDNPLYVQFRGIRLIEYLYNNDVYGDELNRYFNEILNIDKDDFIYKLLALSIGNGQEPYFAEFVYNSGESDEFLDYLSNNQYMNKEYSRLLTVKKTPFYKDKVNRYIILDISFLTNKSYNFFINDFWFDYLKLQENESGKSIFNIKHYRSIFGLFFEEYIREIVGSCFHHLMHPRPFLFDDLRIDTSYGKIEVADIYIRQNKKILVGQVKSSSIYDNEKYGGDINTLYRNNRERFFKDFGVNQTYNSINNILNYANSFDPKLKHIKRLEFYPVIIVNDKVFQTPLLPNLLYLRFNELLKDDNFTPHIIHPLVVMHVSDWEYLEAVLHSKDEQIWDILKSHYKKINNTLMPPFFNSTEKFIKPGVITGRLRTEMKEIINKYTKKVEE